MIVNKRGIKYFSDAQTRESYGTGRGLDDGVGAAVISLNLNSPLIQNAILLQFNVMLIESYILVLPFYFYQRLGERPRFPIGRVPKHPDLRNNRRFLGYFFVLENLIRFLRFSIIPAKRSRMCAIAIGRANTD